MFECKYKFKLEDSLECAKYVYKSQKKKKDIVIACLLPVLIVAMIVMLVYDAVNGKSLVWDIILLVALVVLQAMYLVMPFIMLNSQKKSYKKQNLDSMDYLQIVIDEKSCTETLFKDEKEVAKNTHTLRALTSYLERDNRLILVFNNIEYVCIKKDALTGDIEKLKATLNKAMSKRVNNK